MRKGRLPEYLKEKCPSILEVNPIDRNQMENQNNLAGMSQEGETTNLKVVSMSTKA